MAHDECETWADWVNKRCRAILLRERCMECKDLDQPCQACKRVIRERWETILEVNHD